MTGFFRGIPPHFHSDENRNLPQRFRRSPEWNVLFSGRFAGMENLFSAEFLCVRVKLKKLFLAMAGFCANIGFTINF